jgi:hypothetical protein
MEIFGEVIGTIVLLALVGIMVYAFYRILKYMLDGIKGSDD